MFLKRLAAGLVFLAGVGLSRTGVALESWPLLALGLIAATLGLWHFFMGGPASALQDPLAVPSSRAASREEPAESDAATARQ